MTVDKFFADTYLQSAEPKVGQSKPIKIIADNGKKYFVKNEYVGSDFQNAVFFQELLCSLLALELKVPVPNFAIIELEKDFIENNAELRFSKKFKPGLHFATEEISSVEDNLEENLELAYRNGLPKIKRAWNTHFKNLDNSHSLPSIIAFDCFIQNGDRFTNNGNLIIGQNEGGKRNIFALDHGHAFGTPYYDEGKVGLLRVNEDSQSYIQWFLRQLIGNRLSLGSVFSGLEQNIDLSERNPFNEIVTDIESLTDDWVEEILNEIPDAWIIAGDFQKNQYLNFLSRQKKLVRSIISKMVALGAFSNHTGGELVWESLQEKSFGIQS